MLTKILSKIISRRSTKKRDRFELLMERANKLANQENVYGLIDLIKIVLRPIQAEHIRNAYLSEPHAAIEELFYSDLGLNCILPEFGQTFGAFLYTDLCRVSDTTRFPKLNLASDVIFPTSWNPSSIVNMLGIEKDGVRSCFCFFSKIKKKMGSGLVFCFFRKKMGSGLVFCFFSKIKSVKLYQCSDPYELK